MSAGYIQWHSRSRDHCQLVNRGWIRLLDFIQAEANPLTWIVLTNSQADALTNTDPVCLSRDLWAFLSTELTGAVYPRRTALAWGGGEGGNGFELWRKLFLQHEGGSALDRVQGVRGCHAFPQCKSIEK